MSSTPAPSDHTPSENGDTPAPDAGPARVMPTSVRVAVIVMSVLAGLLLVFSALTWLGREALIDRLVEDGSITRGEANTFIVSQLIPNVVLGLVLAASAWFLPRRHPWARWLGLAGTTLLALLSLLSIVLGGAVSVVSLLLLVLSMAAVVSLLSRTTSAWVPRLRSKS